MIEVDRATIEAFVGARLTEASVWESPRRSDGLRHLRIIEGSSERLRVCGEIWDISDQTSRAFWLEIQAGRWSLHFNAVNLPKRRGLDAMERADEATWTVTLSGAVA